MITSDKQHQAAQDKLTMLKDSLNAPDKSYISKAIAQVARRRQTQELIDDIQAEIEDYHQTRQMKPSEIVIETFDDLSDPNPLSYRLISVG